MTHPYYPTGNPRFNHVAMSLPADLLDATNRKDVCRFFDEVLGFTEMEVMTEDRKRLIMSCVHWDQFIFLIAEKDPMRCPRMDHYGFAVGSLDELRGVQERAEAYRETDDRLESNDRRKSDTVGRVVDSWIHSHLRQRSAVAEKCKIQGAKKVQNEAPGACAHRGLSLWISDGTTSQVRTEDL